MKKLYLALLCLPFMLIAHAQSPLPVGKAQLNLGFGFSNRGLPVYGGFDYSVHKDITIGAEFSYRSYRENWKSDTYRHNIMGFSGNANYHFNHLFKIPTTWDLYAGLNAGFYTWNSPSGYDGTYRSGFGLGAQVGGRYYFTNKLGVNLEFGGGNAFSGGKFGISIKL